MLFEGANYPAGIGAEGTDEVIDAICTIMQGPDGTGAPGRTTIQPVIAAVLRRVRSVGN